MTRQVLLFLITASLAVAAPTDDGSYENRLKTADEETPASESVVTDSTSDNSIKNRDSADAENPDDKGEIEGWNAEEMNSQLTTDTSVTSSTGTEWNSRTKNNDSKDRRSKRGRNHKALFIDYPFVPQISAIPNFESYDDPGSEERTPGGGSRKRYHESNIYYIRLPPTPYMFVPGLGYVSQPPGYSTGPMRPQIPHVRPQVNPYRPHNVYNSPLNDLNPFINLPIDFVSNGKPTSVYQWQSPSYQPSKRPESQITTLDKGPYFFNGRPHSIYLLRPDDRPPVHQSLQYPDYQDNSYY